MYKTSRLFDRFASIGEALLPAGTLPAATVHMGPSQSVLRVPTGPAACLCLKHPCGFPNQAAPHDDLPQQMQQSAADASSTRPFRPTNDRLILFHRESAVETLWSICQCHVPTRLARPVVLHEMPWQMSRCVLRSPSDVPRWSAAAHPRCDGLERFFLSPYAFPS